MVDFGELEGWEEQDMADKKLERGDKNGEDKKGKPPVSGKLILLCGVWYGTSILSNTSSKAILTALPMPVTLTLVQFLFVSGLCMFFSWLARIYPPLRNAVPALRYGIRRPSRELVMTTLPLTAFQIGGHILSSDAMARIPVSLVHTIKGLSPLFTVLAYRFFLNVKYSSATYLSLVPLTLGVIMACSTSFSSNFLGLLYAFGSALLFVTQNIVSKKLFNEAARAEADGIPRKNAKPDKLNLLCYSSGLAFVFTVPIWFWSEGFGIIGDFLNDASVELSERPGSLDHGRLALEFIFNGSFHFGQNLVAFVLLGLVSPVTYSVASLIKRVFVIVFAIIWFGNPMTKIKVSASRSRFWAWQGGADVAAVESGELCAAPEWYEWRAERARRVWGITGRPRAPSGASPGNTGMWLPPGTKAEETWNNKDLMREKNVG
ncbi:hypothetical protein H2203_006498 [Taxawa tesnikishii (nom. ined.)]|nr:hypothetical protein H2203_006498 [Dothideales sp. JES 119]